MSCFPTIGFFGVGFNAPFSGAHSGARVIRFTPGMKIDCQHAVAKGSNRIRLAALRGLMLSSLPIAAIVPIADAQEVFLPPDTPTRYQALLSDESITIDGRLAEPAWQRAEPITEIVQKDPDRGQPISHDTVVYVAYDDVALYVAAICYQPRDTTRVQNLRRDFSDNDNDLFGIAIDGFLDQRSAVVFQTTPYGSQRDMDVIDSSRFNANWDARWSFRTTICTWSTAGMRRSASTTHFVAPASRSSRSSPTCLRPNDDLALRHFCESEPWCGRKSAKRGPSLHARASIGKRV